MPTLGTWVQVPIKAMNEPCVLGIVRYELELESGTRLLLVLFKQQQYAVRLRLS
jgi:hypothetical protein